MYGSRMTWHAPSLHVGFNCDMNAPTSIGLSAQLEWSGTTMSSSDNLRWPLGLRVATPSATQHGVSRVTYLFRWFVLIRFFELYSYYAFSKYCGKADHETTVWDGCNPTANILRTAMQRNSTAEELWRSSMVESPCWHAQETQQLCDIYGDGCCEMMCDWWIMMNLYTWNKEAMMLYGLDWCRMMSDDVVWCCTMLCDVVWCCMMPYDAGMML